MFRTKPHKSDLVKPRFDENAAYDGQVSTNQNILDELEAEHAAVDKDSQNFDKDAFDKLKNEIKERKDAKTRLLNQGLPEFDGYLRF